MLGTLGGVGGLEWPYSDAFLQSCSVVCHLLSLSSG